MELLEGIITRRSIRVFKSDPVSDEQVQTILKAAMYAPSAGNQRPWHFVVITDRQLLDAVPGFHPHARMMKEAPLGILVCGDTRKELHPGYWVQDCSAATQNLLLAAHAVGLGAVWLGIHPREDRVRSVRDLFKLPDPVCPLAMIAIGQPGETRSFPDRFEREKIQYNIWKEPS